MTARYFESYDLDGNRTGVWEQEAFEPDEQFERRVRRQFEARELAELNERLRASAQQLRRIRRFAQGGAGGDAPEPRQARSSDDLLQAATVRELREKGLDPAKVQADLRSTDRVKSAKAGQLIEQAQRSAVTKISYGGSRTRALAETPPHTSSYTRAPDSHVDEGDVAAGEGEPDQQEPGQLETDNARGFDLERDIHKKMVGQHMHGRYHLHLHDGSTDAYGNADHSRAALKAGPALGKNY